MLRPDNGIAEIFVYRRPVDFRKAANGLAVLVEQELGHNPFSGQLYLFTNRHRNKIKGLFWERNGFVLYYKSLHKEKFQWPTQVSELVTLTGQQVNWLLDGYDINAMTPHKNLQYEHFL